MILNEFPGKVFVIKVTKLLMLNHFWNVLYFESNKNFDSLIAVDHGAYCEDYEHLARIRQHDDG